MTTSPHIVPGRSALSLDYAAIEIRWSAVRGAAADRRVEFVLSVQPVDAEHAVVACFIETATGTREFMPRRPMRCTIVEDDRLLHIDARIDGRRVIAISYEPGDGDTEGQLLYAQCSLLSEAGFAAGGFDPPILGAPYDPSGRHSLPRARRLI